MMLYFCLSVRHVIPRVRLVSTSPAVHVPDAVQYVQTAWDLRITVPHAATTSICSLKSAPSVPLHTSVPSSAIKDTLLMPGGNVCLVWIGNAYSVI